jgi:hypothetical protein
MLQQRAERLRNPGDYNVVSRQCTGFVRNSLKACGIPAGSNDPRPNRWFPTLPGKMYLICQQMRLYHGTRHDLAESRLETSSPRVTHHFLSFFPPWPANSRDFSFRS